jgi:hypothetical protein
LRQNFHLSNTFYHTRDEELIVVIKASSYDFLLIEGRKKGFSPTGEFGLLKFLLLLQNRVYNEGF